MKYAFILTLAFVEFVLYLSDDMYIPALSIIAKDLRSSVHVAQYTLSAWYLGTGLFQIPMGMLCDIIGRKKLILMGIVIFVFSSIICAVTDNMYTMIMMRFFQGVSISCMDVSAYTLIHEDNDDRNAVKIVSLISSISIFAPIIGPILGVFFLEFANWRYIFSFLGGCGIICFFSVIKFMISTNTHKTKKFSISISLSEYIKLFKNKKFIMISTSRGLILGSILIWVVQSPLVLLEIFSRWTFAGIQSGLFLFFSIGTILTRKLVDKFPIEKIIKRILPYYVLVNALMVLFYNNMKISFGLMGMFLFLSPVILSVLNRITINQSDQAMSTRNAIFQTVNNTISGIGVFAISFSTEIGFFYIFFGMLISTALSWFIYNFSRH